MSSNSTGAMGALPALSSTVIPASGASASLPLTESTEPATSKATYSDSGASKHSRRSIMNMMVSAAAMTAVAATESGAVANDASDSELLKLGSEYKALLALERPLREEKDRLRKETVRLRDEARAIECIEFHEAHEAAAIRTGYRQAYAPWNKLACAMHPVVKRISELTANTLDGLLVRALAIENDDHIFGDHEEQLLADLRDFAQRQKANAAPSVAQAACTVTTSSLAAAAVDPDVALFLLENKIFEHKAVFEAVEPETDRLDSIVCNVKHRLHDECDATRSAPTFEEREAIVNAMPEFKEYMRLREVQELERARADDLVKQMWEIKAQTPEGRRAKLLVLLGYVMEGEEWRRSFDEPFDITLARDLMIEFVGGEPAAQLRDQFA
jgi:hypothetical protein